MSLNQCRTSLYLAWRDWKFESMLSLCAVLALASMLTPLLVLQGVKNGIIDGMKDRLLQDPSVLIITPKSDAGRYDHSFIAWLGSLEGARYAVGRTRETAADLSLFNPDARQRASISLEPATSGEPVLQAYGMPIPEDGHIPQIVLSTPAALALKAESGQTLEARLGRRAPDGKLESVPLEMLVVSILPIQAADRKLGFVSASLLEDMENYRDYIEVKERGFSGDPAKGERQYASFRLYASSLDDVERLAAALGQKNIEVNTRARDIAAIRMLENAINQVILIISLAVGAGFAAFAISSAHGAASRKRRMLGMLRLLGLRKLPLTLYPMTQSMLTAIAGFGLSILVYMGASFGIAKAFADRGGLECRLGWENVLFTFLAVVILSALSCARASWTAASVEPSMVIREV